MGLNVQSYSLDSHFIIAVFLTAVDIILKIYTLSKCLIRRETGKNNMVLFTKGMHMAIKDIFKKCLMAKNILTI